MQKVDKTLLTSVLDFLSSDKSIYYYANNALYDEAYGYYDGNEEYLISVNEPLQNEGVQTFIGYFSDEPMTLKTEDGFEREIVVFEVISDEEISDIGLYYESYIDNKKMVSKCKKNIEALILGETVTSSNKTKNKKQASNKNEYICPTSDTKKMTRKQVLQLSKEERWIAKNEIYARYGRKFNNEELQDYFNSTSWYAGIIEPEDFDESVFTKIEKENIKLLAKYE